MQIVKGHPYFKVRSFSTVREMLWQSVDLYHDQVAFRYREQPAGELQTKTYGAFKKDIQALGSALLGLGLGNCRLAVIGENSYAWCLVHAATICGAGTIVPLDRLLPAEEIISLLDRGEVDAVFYDPSFHGTMIDLHRNLYPAGGHGCDCLALPPQLLRLALPFRRIAGILCQDRP